jgi:hypothetical protein
MKWGMKFSETGKPVSDDRNLIYTSDRNQFKVDVKADPPHLGLLDPMPTMTNLTTTTTNYLASEILLRVEHHMPFTPSVSVYMNVIDTPTDYAFLIGTYVVDLLRLGGTLIYADADETYFYIRHDKYHNFNMGSPATQTETDLEQFNIRAKWLISNARFVGEVARIKP